MTSAMNTIVATDAAGHHGDGNSDAGSGLCAISRFIATWEARIITQTQTVAKVAIEAIRRKTSSGMTAFRTTPTSRMPVIITTVIHGTPWRDTLPKLAGACPCRDSPKRIRPAPKMSLLIADSAAVMTTALRMWGAAGMPSPLKICTNGLPLVPISFHGNRLIRTPRVST